MENVLRPSIKRYFIFKIQTSTKVFGSQEQMEKWVKQVTSLYPDLKFKIKLVSGNTGKINIIKIKDKQSTILFSCLENIQKWMKVVNELDLDFEVKSIPLVSEEEVDSGGESKGEIERGENKEFYLVQTKLGFNLFAQVTKLNNWIHKMSLSHPDLSFNVEKLILDV